MHRNLWQVRKRRHIFYIFLSVSCFWGLVVRAGDWSLRLFYLQNGQRSQQKCHCRTLDTQIKIDNWVTEWSTKASWTFVDGAWTYSGAFQFRCTSCWSNTQMVCEFLEEDRPWWSTICQIPLNIFHIFCSGAEWRTGSRGVYLQCPCLGLYSFKCWMCFYIDVLSSFTLQNVCSNLLFLLSCSLFRQQQMYCYTCIC